jgi:D-beta-D-heptose 7-phosphate kinase/D-beta-D-heptose 1-phosphate adenosyltransferase
MMTEFSDNIYMTFTSEQIRLLVEGLRSKGRKIVFTNGVFDILHYGHIEYLTHARSLGDVLIVGLNSDSSVKTFKESNRPVQSEDDRARILAALRTVDYVVRFTEETPENLIKLVKPDILVKGADYKKSEIVGAVFVESYGGHVKRIKLARGRSTTNIIDRIKKM